MVKEQYTSKMVAELGMQPPQERISERIREQIVDTYVSQVVEQVTELPKTPSRDRTLQGTVEPVLDVLLQQMVEQLLEVPRILPRDRILQRTVKQIVDRAEAEVQKAEEVVELLKGESTLVETMNASLDSEEMIGASRSVLHTASADLQSHIDSLKRDISPSHAHSTSRRKRSDTQQQLALLVGKLKMLAGATQTIQSEAGGAEGQTDSLFQESSGASFRTSTDLEGLKVATMVRRLAAQEQSAALAQLTPRISGIFMKFSADIDEDPFVVWS